MATAFQCDGFQNSAFQVDCQKRKSEATYHPVVFQQERRKEEDLLLAMYTTSRIIQKKRGRIRLV